MSDEEFIVEMLSKYLGASTTSCLGLVSWGFGSGFVLFPIGFGFLGLDFGFSFLAWLYLAPFKGPRAKNGCGLDSEFFLQASGLVKGSTGWSKTWI